MTTLGRLAEGGRSVRHHVIDRLRHAIVTGEMVPGERLSEFQYDTELDAGWCAITGKTGDGVGWRSTPPSSPRAGCSPRTGDGGVTRSSSWNPARAIPLGLHRAPPGAIGYSQPVTGLTQ